ncbi:MAG TPA: RDD family protein [Dyella sp.]
MDAIDYAEHAFMEVWIGRDGERHGPYTEVEVRQWLRSGQVSASDLGWYEGLADWQPLSALFPEEQTQPAAPPPPISQARPSQTTSASLDDNAGFWKRVAAYLIDSVLLYIPSALIEKMMGGDAAQATLEQAQLSASNDAQAMMAALSQYYTTMMPSFLIITAMIWLYFAVCESSAWQATIGKLALRIRVTDMQGQRISFLRAFGRYPAKYLSALILGVGFLMVGWTQRKQALHDLIANTLVLNGRAGELKDASKRAGTHEGSFNA